MNKPHFIVISGRKQTGKSTLGEMIASKFISDFNENLCRCHLTSFAEPLKEFCYSVFGIEDCESEEGKQTLTKVNWSDLHRPALIQDDYDKKTGPMTVREILQYLGSNILRNRFYNDIWASGPFNKKWYKDYVIITDCRFKNELEYARKNNATIIRIERDSAPIDTHISESALDGIDWSNDIVIKNNGTLEELLDTVKTQVIPKLLNK